MHKTHVISKTWQKDKKIGGVGGEPKRAPPTLVSHIFCPFCPVSRLPFR